MIGGDQKATLADVYEMLKNSANTDSDRKLKLVSLLIVHGVLITTHQIHRPTFTYVDMLKKHRSLFGVSMGREFFLKTISSMRPGKKLRMKF